MADGCGLAAPQVGVNKRIVIVDGRDLSDTYDYLHDFVRIMINPVVLEESEETCEYSEGCLSVPGVYAEVVRPSKIKVEYYNEATTSPTRISLKLSMFRPHSIPLVTSLTSSL